MRNVSFFWPIVGVLAIAAFIWWRTTGNHEPVDLSGLSSRELIALIIFVVGGYIWYFNSGR